MTPFQRRPWILAALLSGCVVFAAACTNGADGLSESGGGTPSVGVETSTDPVEMSGGYEVGADGKLLKPSDAPVPVKPSPPTVMSSNTPEGAEAFARYFVEMTEYAWNSGDSDSLRGISISDCDWCSGIASSIDKKYSSGGWVNDLRYEISSVESPVPFPGDSEKYAIVIHVNTSGHKNYDGGQLSELSPRKERVEIHEARVDDCWKAFGGLGSGDESS